jgi:hypothetical protein
MKPVDYPNETAYIDPITARQGLGACGGDALNCPVVSQFGEIWPTVDIIVNDILLAFK